ncbi:MAG: YraN family protein [Alphaproteobacteria bacterium]|nr:YraN family protein [Alphaproteobacteria bacterium]MDE6571112.1 YraN family protein [Alphaproteobacteria bacterium]
MQNRMRSDYPTSYQTGLRAEFWARMYLRLHGFRIIHTRYVTGRHTGRAEIDIIARRKNLIVFCEVKHRPTPTDAWDAITARQNARLRAAAETYLMRTGWRGDARFDVIIVTPRGIQWVKNSL